jgi:Glyoxalase-like domain
MEDIDHLVYAVRDLDTGMDRIEQLLGVRPALGGRHEQWGTHNALIALSPQTYLEIIAPDPRGALPARGIPFDPGATGARLVTWAYRCEALDDVAARAVAAGLRLGAVEAGHRERPDGTVLYWKLTDPYALPFDGAVPFLISWGATPHPASVASRAGLALLEFRIEHPDPAGVRRALAWIGARIDVTKANTYRLVVRIRTEHGDVDLR